MSIIVARASQAGKLKPEIRLAQAVSQFKQSLSDEQKLDLEASASTALTSTPDPSDVMRFTAELNQRGNLTARSRCYGPRFTNFLHCVQQFAALGDVVVGGSQNILACSVWSLVRMSLLATINITTYFEGLSMIFMDIGRTAPRNQSLALLYRHSSELQAYLCEYFIVVVDLCSHILKFTQASAFRKMTTSCTDGELKTYQTSLHQWSNLIKEEVNLRLVSRVELEAQENSKFRIMSRKRHASVAHERHLTAHLRMLERCSEFDYETTWKQFRKQGNTNNFSKTAQYRDWRDSKQSNTLSYYGKLGCGKSVMMANLVEELVVHVKSHDDNVAYFFCQHDIPEGLQARTIIATLTRQLLHPWSKIGNMRELIGSETRPLRLLQMLWNQLPDTHRAYIVVDGLDLCEALELEQLFTWAQELQASYHVLVCVSSRHGPESAVYPIINRSNDIGMVSFPENTADIDAFIDMELERCIHDGSLPVQDPSILPDLRDALSTGAHGMFLWVVLQIKVLCATQTDRELREALKHLPRSLTDIYESALRRKQGLPFVSKYQERIFAFATAAWRPMTLSEFREALSITPGDVAWDKSQLLNNIYSTLSCCGCLIVVDEEELTVRLVHPSVETYLLEAYTGPDGTKFTTAKAHSYIADHVVTYLSYAVFQGEVTRNKIPEVDIGPAPSRVFASALSTSSQATRMLAIRFLRAGRQPSIDVRKTLAEALQSHRQTLNHEFQFHGYARKHSVLHLTNVIEPGPIIAKLLPNLLERNIITTDVEHVIGFDSVEALARTDNLTIFKLLFIERKGGKVVQKQRLDDAVRLALLRDDATCIPLLVKTGYIRYDYKMQLQPTASLDTPLSHAVAQNSIRVARALLPVSNMTDTMFTDAIKNGRDAMARLLFMRKHPIPASFNLNYSDFKLRPLWLAVVADRPQIVEMLIETRRIKLTIVEEVTVMAEARSVCVEQLLDAGGEYWDRWHEQTGRIYPPPWRTPQAPRYRNSVEDFYSRMDHRGEEEWEREQANKFPRSRRKP